MTSASSEPFHPIEVQGGRLLDLPGVRLSGLAGDALELPAGATHFGLISSGRVKFSASELRLNLLDGMWFVEPGAVSLSGGVGVVISLAGYAGLRQLGGPLEARGRLRYIDGCTDTLLVCPPRLGDPCLNHLHLPANTDQSPHHHDGHRLGIVARGHGWCRTDHGRFPLRPGLAWWIEAGGRHSFVTEHEALDVFAWHPDSTFGPTDEAHPMVTRTLVDGP